jgi:hypothetical protein
MTDKIDQIEKIITATLKLAETKPWSEITMENIANVAKIKPALLMKHVSSKLSILDAFNRQLDNQTHQYFRHIPDQGSIRDQLFDILMARFDALQIHKPSLNQIFKMTVPFDPIASACGLKSLIISMQSILELMGTNTHSPIGIIKAKVLSTIFFRSFLVWLKDDSIDMAMTMAKLNQDLTTIETLMNKYLRSQ